MNAGPEPLGFLLNFPCETLSFKRRGIAGWELPRHSPSYCGHVTGFSPPELRCPLHAWPWLEPPIEKRREFGGAATLPRLLCF